LSPQQLHPYQQHTSASRLPDCHGPCPRPITQAASVISFLHSF